MVKQRLGNTETEEMRKARPLTDKWTFSTNGVSIMGRNEMHVDLQAREQRHSSMHRTKKHGRSTW